MTSRTVRATALAHEVGARYGTVASVTRFPTGLCHHVFDVDLGAQGRVVVRIADPEQRRLLLGALALHRRRDGPAGFWLALAFSLKLFSVLVLAYLLFKGRWRAFAWSLLFVAVFWLALPALDFGVGGACGVYEGWLGQLTHAASHQANADHPILTSLQRGEPEGFQPSDYTYYTLRLTSKLLTIDPIACTKIKNKKK